MALNKINEIIKANGIKPSECRFHTIREIKDESDKPIGRTRILVWKNDPDNAHVELTCPKCKKENYIKTEWNDFKSESGRKTAFVVICPSCSYKHEVRRMNDEVKRAQKKASKGDA